MSKLKLNLKNFQGNENIDYWVTHYVATDGNISLTLNMSFRGKNIEADSIHSNSFFNKGFEFQSFEERLEYVLKSAESEWGIELTKANIKVA